MNQINSSTEILRPANDKYHEAVELGSTNAECEIKKQPPEYHPSGGLLGKFVSCRNNTNRSLAKYSKQISYTTYALLHILLIAYFAWATKYFIDQDPGESLGSTTCTGYGFLMILFIFINFGIAYSLILKPHCFPIFNRIVWKPLKRSFKSLFKYRCSRILGYGLIFACTIGYLIYNASGDFTKLTPLIGLASYFLIGLLMCNNPGRINWQPVIWGFYIQFGFGLLTIKWEVGRNIFGCIGDKVTQFLGYADYGAAFVYGDFLIHKQTIFVFQALSAIYFLSFFVNILYHYGIMQRIILAIGQFLQALMGTSICESVNSAANIFLGMTESPLIIKPYLEDLTASELYCIMSTGFSTVAGTVLAAYISFGANAAHLITASVMSAPAALCYTKLVYPETEETKATKESISVSKSEYSSALDAASSGASTAIELVLGITANVIAFISFFYFANGVLGFLGELVGYAESDAWTVEKFAGYLFMPVSYTLGVPWEECGLVGKLIGLKTIVNEFAAFKEMGNMTLTPRTKVIATYAICGFSNPGSIGIMISTMSVLMPNKRELITRLVFKAFVAGAIVCFMTACIAALLIPDDL